MKERLCAKGLLRQEKVRILLSVLREVVKATRRGDVCHGDFPGEQEMEF